MEPAEATQQNTEERGELAALFDRHSPHLQELWTLLYRAAILFSVTFAAAFFLTQPILTSLIKLVRLEHVTLITTRPFQFLDLAVDIAMFFAFLVSIPYVVWQLCMFIRPAVSAREFRLFLLTLPLSLILFAIGFAYGFWTLFLGLQILADLNIAIGLANYWDIGPFLSGIVLTATLLGALFQLPLIMTFCIRAGMCQLDAIVRRRRAVWAGIFVFVSLLPPTDGLSLIVMSIPLIILFELTVFLNR